MIYKLIPQTPRERTDGTTKQTTLDWKVAVLISRGTYIQGWCWAAARQIDLHKPVTILSIFIEALTGFSQVYHPDDLNITLLSQGYLLETASIVAIVGAILIPRTGVEGDTPVAQVQG